MSVDIRDAYLHVPMSPCSNFPQILTICGRGLAFSVCGPTIWTGHISLDVQKSVNPSAGLVKGPRSILGYLDDLSLRERLAHHLRQNVSIMIHTLEVQDRVFNMQKSGLELAQYLEYLEYLCLILDTIQTKVFLALEVDLFL